MDDKKEEETKESLDRKRYYGKIYGEKFLGGVVGWGLLGTVVAPGIGTLVGGYIGHRRAVKKSKMLAEEVDKMKRENPDADEDEIIKYVCK